MTEPVKIESATLADDLLNGVGEIAEYTGWKERRVYHLIENAGFPAFKVGGRLCARRSTILVWIKKLEAKS